MVTRIKLNLLGAVIGGALGYLAGIFIVDNFVFTPAEVDQLDDPYGGHTEDEKEMPLEPQDPAILFGHNKNAKKVGVVRNYNSYFDRPDIAQLAAKYNGELPAQVEERLTEATDPDQELNTIEFEVHPPDEDKPIQIISHEEYLSGDSGFEKVTLNFYADDVLTDDKDEPLSRPERIIGDDALVSFGQLSGDPDIVYVRNTILRGEYEVIRCNKNYGPEASRSPKKRRRVKTSDGESAEH